MTDLDTLVKLAADALARAEKATAGPWGMECPGDCWAGELKIPPHYSGVFYWSDVKFIAAARTDIPTLARAVIDLVARVKELEEQVVASAEAEKAAYNAASKLGW